MKFKKLMSLDAESQRLIDWIEKGVYDALQKKYLKTLLFSICESATGPTIEEYAFSFSYPNPESQEVLMNINRTGNKKLMKLTDEVTPNQMKGTPCKMIRTLVQLIRTLDQVPEERTILMKLLYHEDVTPVDYEPPFLRGGTEEERNPLRMDVGNVNSKHFVPALKVKSVLDPCEDENEENQDESVSLSADSFQKDDSSNSGSKVSSSQEDHYIVAPIDKEQQRQDDTMASDGENLKSRLGDANQISKEIKVSLDNLKRQTIDLQMEIDEFSKDLAASLEETENLKQVVIAFASLLIKLDEQNATSDKHEDETTGKNESESSELEPGRKENGEKLLEYIKEKDYRVDRHLVGTHSRQLQSLEKQATKLDTTLKGKQQPISEFKIQAPLPVHQGIPKHIVEKHILFYLKEPILAMKVDNSIVTWMNGRSQGVFPSELKGKIVRIVGVCCGVICVICKRLKKYVVALINPYSGRYAELPFSFRHHPILGFGGEENDLKVVRLANKGEKRVMEMYYLTKRKMVSRFEDVPQYGEVNECGVLAEDILCWKVVTSMGMVVIRFNIMDDKWLNAVGTNQLGESLHMRAYEGCLCIVILDGESVTTYLFKNDQWKPFLSYEDKNNSPPKEVVFPVCNGEAGLLLAIELEGVIEQFYWSDVFCKEGKDPIVKKAEVPLGLQVEAMHFCATNVWGWPIGAPKMPGKGVGKMNSPSNLKFIAHCPFTV